MFLYDWISLKLMWIVVAALGTLYLYFKYVVFNYWDKLGVPYVEPTVPFGNFLPTVRGKVSPGEMIQHYYMKMKQHRYFGIYALQVPQLVVNDPELIRTIMTKEFAHFHDRGLYLNEKVDPLSAHLFFLPGSRWKNLRGKLSPTFTSGKMRQMFYTIKECGDDLANCLYDRAKAEGVIEIKDLLARYSTDVIASAAFGIKSESLKNPDAEFRHWGRKSFESKPIQNAITLFAPGVADLLSLPLIDRGASNFFYKAFEDTVEYRNANNVTRKDFLDLIRQLMNKGYVDSDEGETPHISESLDGKINMIEGAAQAFVFFLAGFETSSSTVTHCLYELVKNPDVQEEVRKDIDRGLEKCGGLTYESLNEMPYLHKVVSETLRMYPSVPILNRICTEDFTLPITDLHIPKGTPVLIPVLGLHRDPDIYPDPERFDPERFSEENIASRHSYAYLPFGEGPRICIGMRFGLVQTKIALVSLLSKYRFSASPQFEVPFKVDPGNFILCPYNGIHLRIENR